MRNSGTTRESREADTRDDNMRAQVWKPPETLPMPDPEPGWKFRWIRVASAGEVDNTNIGMKRREGWEFVKASEMPDLALSAGVDPTSGDRIEIGGLALGKIPEEIMRQRREFYQNLTDNQVNRVDADLNREMDPRMPIINQGSTRTSGGPRRF